MSLLGPVLKRAVLSCTTLNVNELHIPALLDPDDEESPAEETRNENGLNVSEWLFDTFMYLQSFNRVPFAIMDVQRTHTHEL